MRAAFCPAPGTLDLRDVPDPKPGAGEIVLRVRACGTAAAICTVSRRLPPPAVVPVTSSPARSRRQAGVTGVREGDAIAVEPLAVCRVQLLPHRATAALPATAHPGLQRPADSPTLRWCRRMRRSPAGRNAVRARRAVRAAAVCVHAVRLAPVALGDRVLILGPARRLAGLIAAHAAGASEVLITARYSHQADMARRLAPQGVRRNRRRPARMGLCRRSPDRCRIESVGAAATRSLRRYGWWPGWHGRRTGNLFLRSSAAGSRWWSRRFG